MRMRVLRLLTAFQLTMLKTATSQTRSTTDVDVCSDNESTNPRHNLTEM